MTFYETALPVIRSATERFAPAFELNGEHFDIFQNYCENLDLLVEQESGEDLQVHVDAHTKRVTVSFCCTMFIVKQFFHPFYGLAERSVSFGFRSVNEDTMQLYYVFPSLWDKRED